MEHGFAKSASEVAAFFNTDVESGLSETQVEINQKKYGPNGLFITLLF
jgi:hypothetical protein